MKIEKIDKIAVFSPRSSNATQDAKSVLGLVDYPIKKHAKMENPTLTYGVRQVFKKSEYNLLEIGTIEDVESYVRQAFQKKTALMFKEGEGFTGKNKQTLDYIKLRIKQMEFVSGIPWRTLLRDTGYALISRSNFFWVKVRNQKASGGRPIGNVAPVAAYFGFGAEYVRLKKDLDDQLILYRQEFPDGRIVQFEPRDIIHFRAYKKPGFDFGTPQITPVKDDIRALRRIEENVELLIYQTLFPIFHYKVGTENRPAGDIRMSDGTIMSEVDYIKNQIATMTAEGGIVTPERHEIEFVGAENKGLKAKEYLDYFKTRVLSGLGVSSVDMGEGDTANRATASAMSSTMIDSVKDYQDILEELINEQVIKELLLESTFDFDVLAPENIVTFKFKEIDIEEQMKKNTNAQVMYNGNIIDLNEARHETGNEPLIPEQEPLMFFNRVTAPQMQMQADAQLQVAQTRMSAKAGDGTTKFARNANAPTNQHGTKTGPQASKLDFLNVNDYHVSSMTRMLKNDIAKHVENQKIDKKWIHTLIMMAADSAVKKYNAITEEAFSKGVRAADAHDFSEKLLKSKYLDVKDYTEFYIKKYVKDLDGKLLNTLDRMVKTETPKKDMVEEVEKIIDAIKYRSDFIDNTERSRAFNYGKACGLKALGFKKAELLLNQDCDICKEFGKELSLTDLTIDSVPPFHSNSKGMIGAGIE